MLIDSLLAWIWTLFVSLAAVLAFYRTHVEPKLRMIEGISLIAISPPQEYPKEPGRYVEADFEVRMREQAQYQFATWVDGEDIPNRATSNDFGKTYMLLVNLPMQGEWLPNEFAIDIKRSWRLYWLTKKKLPIPSDFQPRSTRA